MTTRQTIKRFLEPAQMMWWSTVRAIIRNIFVNIQSPINAFFIWLLWASIESWNSSKSFDLLIIYWCTLGFIHILLEISKERWWPQTFYQQIRWIQNIYLKKYTQTDGNYLDSIGTGKIISIMNSWFDKRSNILVNITWSGTSFILNFISGIYFSTRINVRFGIWYIVLFWCVFAVSIYYDAPAKKLRNARRDAINDGGRALIRFIMSRSDIIQNNKVNYEIDNVWQYTDKATKYTLDQATPQSRMYNIPRLLINIFRFTIYIVGWKMYFSWKITIGELTTMLWFMLVVDEILIKSISAYKDISKDINTVTKLRDIFDKAPKIIGFNEWLEFAFQKWEISVNNIVYEYNSSNLVFNNFSLNISWWSRIALVWPSGWGKTTLVKLIAWYLHPQSWQILVDWQALPTPQNISPLEKEGLGEVYSHISLQSYYPHIWYLTQEPSVFDGTVWENLTYGVDVPLGKGELKGDLSRDNNLEKKIDKIIKLARCEFIYEFKDWLQTEIGEKGIRLSWWQRQRLAIAKIMLKDPDIILLDEPTSALDSENEELVTQALNELFKGKTVIVIAHRLQTVKHSDQILYIDWWQVIESWTHQELLAMKWKYYKMVELQSGF